MTSYHCYRSSTRGPGWLILALTRFISLVCCLSFSSRLFVTNRLMLNSHRQQNQRQPRSGEPCPLWPVAAKAWTTPLVVDVDVVPSRFPPFVSQLPKAQGLIHMSMISSPRPSWSHFDPHKLPTGTPDFERGEQIHAWRSCWEICEARHTLFGRLDAWTPSNCHKRPSVCDNTPKFHISLRVKYSDLSHLSLHHVGHVPLAAADPFFRRCEDLD